jgi:branched-chain amino acid transport system ATP-binding protein
VTAKEIMKVTGLEAGYGPKQVLYGIDLAVQEGEIVAIIGHNGAGKSTLLKALFGLIPVWKGELWYKGEAVKNWSPPAKVRKGIAYAPQGNRVFTELTVRENLETAAYTLDGKAQVEKKMDDAYSLFPALKSRQAQLAGSLSGGEKQMLSLANILMLSPRLLLLDEPSLGLSPSLVREAFQKLTEINRLLGTTILIVEQKVREVLKISQRAYLLKMGRVIYSGASADLLAGDRIREIFL